MKFTYLAAGLLTTASTVLAAPTPPGIPSAGTAQTQLAGLTVAAYNDDGTYDRDLFPTWTSSVEDNCNTRQYVLKRDATSIKLNSDCSSSSGEWTSPYDGLKWTAASDLDIDHMVPVKNAWVSGAKAWTTDKRRQFANDITRPQLWAVTDSSNRSKGDRSPDAWKPELASFHCTYARSWVAVKSYWKLTVTSAEKSALTTMLNTC